MNKYGHICDGWEEHPDPMRVERRCPTCGERLMITADGRLSCDVDWVDQEGLHICDYSEPLPEDIRLREMGAPMLPLGLAS